MRLDNDAALFGIIQGGVHPDLRGRSLDGLQAIGFDGYGIGGLAVGESESERNVILEYLHPRLPTDRPRYLMGVGRPEDLVESVARGVDMFDCVMPTRHARNGQYFTGFGTVKIRNACYARMWIPLSRAVVVRLVLAAILVLTSAIWTVVTRCWHQCLVPYITFGTTKH